MTPGWNALADHDFQTVLPLPARRKFGIDYICTPPFLQKVDMCSSVVADTKALCEFLNSIPSDYKHIDLALGTAPGLFSDAVTERFNNILDLKRDYAEIKGGYSTDARRNLRIAGENKQELLKGVKPAEAIHIFRDGPGRGLGRIRNADYHRLEQLMEFTVSNRIGDIVGVRASGRLVYTVFYIDWRDRISLLFTSTSPMSRTLRSGYLAIDHIIGLFSGRRDTLDFAGSSIESIASYNRSFGAAESKYYRFLINRLPFPLKHLKQGFI